MSDPSNHGIEETPEESLEWVRHDIKVRGARAAYAALLDVCENPKAPAPSKATAGVALLRAAGMFDKADDPSDIEPHQMTASQLNRAIKKLRTRIRSPESAAGDRDDTADGVFG